MIKTKAAIATEANCTQVGCKTKKKLEIREKYKDRLITLKKKIFISVFETFFFTYFNKNFLIMKVLITFKGYRPKLTYSYYIF